jgi:CRP-like cAMP-binding protein
LQFITYVNAGSLRQFTNADGKDLTIHFFTEQMWAADAESFFTQQPAMNYIEATEETEIVTMSVIDFHAMMSKYPAFGILGSVMNNWSISTSRFTALSSMSPDERYSNLMSEHPAWINRFPQHQIASYLAMTPETLSRVRSRINRN